MNKRLMKKKNDAIRALIRRGKKDGWLEPSGIFYELLVTAYGANPRAIGGNLKNERELEAAIRFLGHMETDELSKNRGTTLILGCGLCEPCKVKANAVTYIRNAEDDAIDREFERRENERLSYERAFEAKIKREFRGLL